MATRRMDDATKDLKSIEINFGEVEVGVTKIKSIKIVNKSGNEQTYVVQRDSISNPLDCVFNTIGNTWSLMPCESYFCDISYRPILPNYKYTDYFSIIDTDNFCYKVTVRGCSTAVNVTSSCKRLVIACDQNCSANKCVELTNKAKIPAKFTFDVDINQCPFKINELSGIIEPLSTKSIDISFQPIAVGIYKYYMPCLILHQKPIILELYGLCDLEPIEISNFNVNIENILELDSAESFTNYMNDTTTIVKNEPPSISLSSNFVDFGAVEEGLENLGKRTPQTVCLTNNNGFELLILWDKDKSDAFNIHPQEARVRGNQSIIFEVRFDPCEKHKFYSRELLARVFRIPCCASNTQPSNKLLMDVIPEFVSIRLIGHTYSNGFNDWTPQYEIPETVTMPACIPALPVYTTFIMENSDQQPLMFRFIPPTTTHFSIKPVMGLITHEQQYQVIVVEFFPEAVAEPAYVERWAVRLNGNSKNEVYFDLQGYAEQANFVFGDENLVAFDPIHLGCRQTRTVSVRNLSRHLVRFEYLPDLPKTLSIAPMSGIVHPNDTVFHDWIFTPDLINSYKFDVSCRLITDIGCRCSTARIEVSGNCAEGSLIAIPEELNFGARIYNESCKMDFKIFNFSSVTIYYQLICRTTKTLESMQNPEKDLVIEPSSGQVNPGKGEQVQVTLNPKSLGFYELTIEYFVTSNTPGNYLLPLTEPKSLCRVNCMSYLPSLKIQDLLYQVDANKGVSKMSLWKSLCIDRFNLALKELQPQEKHSIQMKVPPLGPNETLIVKLLLINPSPIDASWIFKKNKICFCNDLEPKNQSLINNKSKSNCCGCVPDKSIEICPNRLKLAHDETEIITISVKASTLLSSGIWWDLDIGHDRYIDLNIKFEDSFILPDSHLKFETVDIKDSSSMRYQAVWLYNNSSNEVAYEVKTKALVCINKRNYAIIFTCLNPTGKIQAYERKPVLFGFCPNKFGKFETNLPIKLGEKQALLKVGAECACVSTKINNGHETCPQSDVFKTCEVVVYFNSDYLILPPISTHGKISRIIVMHNHHQRDVLSYAWKNYEIPGVLKVSIEPASGLIRPQSILTFVIEIFVGSYECLLDIDVNCQFVDVTERRLAEKKRIEQECTLKRMNGEFSIDGKGSSFPKKPISDSIKEPSTFWKALTLRIKVYDFYNANSNIDVEQQLKSVPAIEETYKSTSHEKMSHDRVQISLSIFENIVWEIVNEKYFLKMMQERLMKKHKLSYSQIPTYINNSNKYLQTKRLKWVPPKQFTNDILQHMICMILHEEFNLDTSHFSPPPDARQISYKKLCMEAFHKQASSPIKSQTMYINENSKFEKLSHI